MILLNLRASESRQEEKRREHMGLEKISLWCW